MATPRKAEVYVLCSECAHTINIHNKDGCRAYECGCKKGH